MHDGMSSKVYPTLESSTKKIVEISPENITGAQLDTLIALVENGPLDDGHVPSKSARDDLVQQEFAAKVVHKGEQGYQAATYKGSSLYCRIFGGSNTIREAKAYRVMQRELRGIRDEKN